jgi:hypothetical protein
MPKYARDDEGDEENAVLQDVLAFVNERLKGVDPAVLIRMAENAGPLGELVKMSAEVGESSGNGEGGNGGNDGKSTLPVNTANDRRIAMDAANRKSLAQRYPHGASIKSAR